MAVIKSNAPEVSSNRRPPSEEAARIVAEAERDAEQILVDAAQQKAGLLQGFKLAGRTDGEKTMTAELERARTQAAEMLKQAERDVLTLALQLAERIIRQDLDRDPSVITDVCSNAIETMRNAKQLTLRVHPRDGALLRERRAELTEKIGRAMDVSIKDDSEVQPGGCVIQTEFGTVDAQLATQLSMLRDVLIVDNARKEGPA